MAQQTVSQVDRGANPWVVAQLVVAVAVLLLMMVFGLLMRAEQAQILALGPMWLYQLMTLHGVPIHRAVATAAGFGGLIAAPSALLFLFTPTENAPPGTIGAVNIPAFLIVIVMTTLTAPFGAALAHKLDAKLLKKVFAVFLMLVALNMLRKALF